jgi:ribonuclease HI
VRGLEQGFALALENAQHNSNSRNKLVVLTDCQAVMKSLAKCLTGEDLKPGMPAVAMAGSKARELRRLGMVVEVRWVPAHMGKKGAEGSAVADQIAKNALAYTSNLPEDRARDLAGEVHRMENPFSRTPRVV